ncbi:MAG: STELLO glycosyltransferase family protein [Bacteroidia bacterium]
MPQTALVITSISAPNTALKTYAEGCAARGIEFVLIGDKASPADFELQGCDFWSLKRQAEMDFSIAGILPDKHYARKNLGYLQAIKNGCEVIIETDDDNFPYKSFWNERTGKMSAQTVEEKGWVNVYSIFSDTDIWPRGYPLELLQPKKTYTLQALTDIYSPIQQGLANENPDVDAVYRLTRELPLNFNKRDAVALGKQSWCPFNSQNTTWFKEAFPLLYLPSYCSFRMTDIWRSFVAQRIAWENNWNILFHESTVWQERNEHNLMKDFHDEVSGYMNNARICSLLESLELKAGPENLGKNILKCYNVFIAEGLVDQKEIALIEAWNKDLESNTN